jgi:hypothetical protein
VLLEPTSDDLKKFPRYSLSEINILLLKLITSIRFHNLLFAVHKLLSQPTNYACHGRVNAFVVTFGWHEIGWAPFAMLPRPGMEAGRGNNAKREKCEQASGLVKRRSDTKRYYNYERLGGGKEAHAVVV